jgi:DNA-directed RNA polymerase sigma subunit (sigma70/sigma32)
VIGELSEDCRDPCIAHHCSNSLRLTLYLAALPLPTFGRLPELPKKVLAMYYYGEFQLDEIASALDLTEYEVDQLRAKVMRELKTMLAARLGHEWHADLISSRCSE